MNIIVKSKTGCGQLLANEYFFYDIWMSGVITVTEAGSEGVDYFGPVKEKSQEIFPSYARKIN